MGTRAAAGHTSSVWLHYSCCLSTAVTAFTAKGRSQGDCVLGKEGTEQYAPLAVLLLSWHRGMQKQEMDPVTNLAVSHAVCFRLQASNECLKLLFFPAVIFYPTVCVSVICSFMLPAPRMCGFIDVTVQMGTCTLR